MDPALFDNLRLELRRGCLVVAVLAALRTEQYGYTLRRLETQGMLVSEWREEDKRNKRFYRLSVDGRQILKQLLVEWDTIDASLRDIVKEPRHGASRSLSAGR